MKLLIPVFLIGACGCITIEDLVTPIPTEVAPTPTAVYENLPVPTPTPVVVDDIVSTFCYANGAVLFIANDGTRHVDVTNESTERKGDLLNAWCQQYGGWMPLAVNGQPRPHRCF